MGASLLIIEAAAPLRRFLRLHLETSGFAVRLADDLATAERMVAQARPDLVLAGNAKGGIDCLDVLERIRSLVVLAATPVIVVSVRGDADSVQQAQVLGASDYLLLPVAREALLDAVRSQLPDGSDLVASEDPPAHTRSGRSHVDAFEAATDPSEQRIDIASTMGVGERVRFLDVPPTPAVAAPDAAQAHGARPAPTALASQEARSGTVLFADIRNFFALAQALNTEELADVLNSFFVRACEPILQQGGWIVKLLGDGILAMFEPRPSGPGHAERALKAGLFLCIVAQRFDEWLKRRFPDKALADFAVGVGVHTGDVMVCRINTGAGVDNTIVGDSVNIASCLEEQTKKLGASVVTTLETLALAGSRFIPGKRGSLLVRGRSAPVEIAEVTGLRPRPNVDAHGLQTYNVISAAVEYNNGVITRERERVLAEPHRVLRSGESAPLRPADTAVNIPGIKLLRHLGDGGGGSRAFLAEHEMTGSPRVLKILSLADSGFDLSRRFLQEHELVSQVHDPHVATVFDSGQTEAYAYIVMEYLTGGDLRSRIAAGMPAAQALEYLRQIARALVAIHARGIVHRNLRPDNLLLREDGTLVLADFGIAEDLSLTVTQPRHGERLDTPYYLSPEQATGQAVDQRGDLYRLGVIFYEMLTGRPPYTADDAPGVIDRHVHDPVPWLPDEMMALQPLLDRLMAKSPDDRFATAADAFKAIRTVQVIQSDRAASK